ncbi:MAG: hypothetical protein ACRERC_19090 [Candidatus Binatia bacterium]
MPSERAKDNKQLVAPCASCEKVMSAELLTGILVGHGRGARLVAVCEPCRAKGWQPGEG